MVSIYELAFTQIYGVGYKTAQEIIKHITPEELFSLSKSQLQALFGNKERTINDILSKSMFSRCEQELDFINKFNIHAHFITNDSYPFRLKQIPDAPLCLFVDGNISNLNNQRIVSIVGSRSNTDYGRYVTEYIVSELKKLNVCIISGLARGIDAISHKASLSHNIPTFGVLGHGLDMIYPRENFDLAMKMKLQGGLISEYFTKTKPIPYNFPARNRIIAGLSDVVIVVEAAKKGGALITARLANDYNREVIAVPGRLGDIYSEGCNFLIENNRASIFSSLKTFEKVMNWEQVIDTNNNFPQTNEVINVNKGVNLDGKKKIIYDTLKTKGELDIDNLSIETGMDVSVLSVNLLELELEDYVMAKPGRVYKVL